MLFPQTSTEFHCQLVLNFSSSPSLTEQLNSRSKALSNSVTAVLMFKAFWALNSEQPKELSKEMSAFPFYTKEKK